jgi:hypothetical protein
LKKSDLLSWVLLELDVWTECVEWVYIYRLSPRVSLEVGMTTNS